MGNTKLNELISNYVRSSGTGFEISSLIFVLPHFNKSTVSMCSYGKVKVERGWVR